MVKKAKLMILMISGFSTSFLIENKTKSMFSHCCFAIFILWSSLRANGVMFKSNCYIYATSSFSRLHFPINLTYTQSPVTQVKTPLLGPTTPN